MMKFSGKKLKQARTKSGMSQQKVADMFGFLRGAIYSWESGRTKPDVDQYLLLKELFREELTADI